MIADCVKVLEHTRLSEDYEKARSFKRRWLDEFIDRYNQEKEQFRRKETEKGDFAQ